MSGSSSQRLPRHSVDRLLAVAAETGPWDADSPGAVDLGKYRLIAEVGRGGMGVVWEAEDTRLGRRVALKLMPETVGLSGVLRRRFAREAQAAAKLSHPHIAAVYEATPDYIAMQFVDGKQLLETPRDDPRRIVTLLRDAAHAVAYAHERGIVHRDLKPSNMLVEDGEDGSSRIYVMDFGLAKEASMDSSLSGSNILGTPAYMSPEQAQGRTREVDARSDVYSLGATLYASLCGAPPFSDDDVLGLLRKVVEEDPKPPRIDPDLDAIVLRSLAKEPERRYASARELAEDLSRWLRGDTVVARHPSVGYRLHKFLLRRKSIVRAVAAALLLATLVFVPLNLSQRAGRESAEAAMRLSEYVDNALVDSRILRQTSVAEARRRLDLATKRCDAFIAETDGVADVYVMRGRLRRMNGDRPGARSDFEHALNLEPGLATARLELGLSLLEEYRSRRALAELPGEPIDETDRRELEAERRALVDLRRRAIDGIRVVIGHEREFEIIDVRYATAEISRLSGNIELARRGFEDVLRMDPRHRGASLSLAAILQNEASGQARAQLLSSRVVDQGRGYGLAFLSGSASSPGELRHGPEDCRAIQGVEGLFVDFSRLTDKGGEAAATAQLALAKIRAVVGGPAAEALQRWQEAVRLLDASLAHDNRIAGVLNNRGLCWSELEKILLALGRGLEAITAHRNAMGDLESALDVQPTCPAARRNRALLRLRQAERLQKLGRYDPAITELRAAVEDCEIALRVRDDADTRIDCARSQSVLASLLADLGRSAKIELAASTENFDRVVRAEPSNARALLYRGIFHASRGRRAAAVRDLEAAMQHAPIYWVHRRRCQHELDRVRGD